MAVRSLGLNLKAVGKTIHSEKSGGRDNLVCIHKSRGRYVAQCPPLCLCLSYTHEHTHTHTHSLHTFSLSHWFVPWVSTLPQLQFLYPGPPLPACLQDTIRTSLCAFVSVYVSPCLCVYKRMGVRAFVGESYCCIYVVRSFQHLMQYDIFHFASNPGYFCRLYRISYYCSSP